VRKASGRFSVGAGSDLGPIAWFLLGARRASCSGPGVPALRYNRSNARLPGSESLEAASVWADEYRHSHPGTGPWHYIELPLADLKIDVARECPNGDCVIGKTEQFLALLRHES
jgi:hypothetical protein